MIVATFDTDMELLGQLLADTDNDAAQLDAVGVASKALKSDAVPSTQPAAAAPESHPAQPETSVPAPLTRDDIIAIVKETMVAATKQADALQPQSAPKSGETPEPTQALVQVLQTLMAQGQKTADALKSLEGKVETLIGDQPTGAPHIASAQNALSAEQLTAALKQLAESKQTPFGMDQSFFSFSANQKRETEPQKT